MPTIDDVITRIAAASAVVPGKRVRLDFGADGCILLDGVEGRVTHDRLQPVDALLTMTFDHFVAMARGSLSATSAFMTGKLRIDGDMSAAMQLKSVLSAAQG